MVDSIKRTTKAGNNDTIARRIRRLRKENLLSLKDLSEKFPKPIDVNLISYWENGRKEPSLERLKELAKILNVSTLWLMYGDDFEDSSSAFSETFRTLISQEMATKKPIDKFYSSREELSKDIQLSVLRAIERWHYAASDKRMRFNEKYPGYPGSPDFDMEEPKYPDYSADHAENPLEYGNDEEFPDDI